MRRNASTQWRQAKAGCWVLLYAIFAAFPLLLLMLNTVPNGGGILWDFSIGLGFCGLSIMGLQFVLTARFRHVTGPFGTDIIYYFHRWAALGGVLLITVHYLVLRLFYAASLGTANPISAPWHMTAGRVALAIFVVLVASSLWRKPLKIEYDRWRLSHGLLAVAAVALGIWHILGVGHYTAAGRIQRAWLAFSVVWILLLVQIRVVKPWLLSRKPCRVTSITAERGDSWTLTVESKSPFCFCPGQFAWVSLGASPFRGKEHPFSFSGSAEKSGELQFTIKELGDFTRTIKYIKPGEIAYVDGPHGVFTTDRYPEARGFGFIAGGVGIAPIMSILLTLADRGERRPLWLIYGSSKWERVLFREKIEELTARLNLSVEHVLEEPPEGSAGELAKGWKGQVGILSESILTHALAGVPEGVIWFVCGPKGMVRSAQQTLRAHKVPLSRIHFEHFEMA